jgi:hypothetical protein
VRSAEDGIFSFRADRRANGMEALSARLEHEHYMLLETVVEGFGNPSKEITGNKKHKVIDEHHASLSKWAVSSFLAQYGCHNEQTIQALEKRNTPIILEQLNPEKMNTDNESGLMRRVIMLKKTGLFSNTPENILVEVASLLREERHNESSIIFEKGDKGDCMYIIYSGEVKVHDDESLIAVFKEHDFFGDLSMLDTETRSATATALVESVLLRLDQDAIYELMNDRIEVAQSVIRILCSRIRDLNKKYVEIEKK